MSSFLLSHPMSLPYPYPISKSDLLQVHILESHFEGGFFKQTVALSSRLQDGVRVQEYSGSGTDWLKTPSASPEHAMDASCIYYLLTPECSRGRLHMNNHAVHPLPQDRYSADMQTFHIHHAGRALYTLIAPPTGPGAEPVVCRVVMGSDPSKGELTQLFVPGG
jgi:predicted cupin superfamily sugar epimerase